MGADWRRLTCPDMALPKDAELLGANNQALEIRDAGAHTIITLTTGAQRKLALGLASASAESSPLRVYLMLENIRGTRDATVLSPYINLPEGAAPGDHRHLLAGSVGLYGLTMASAAGNENGGQGLAFILDITRILIELVTTKSLEAGKIRVSVVPNRQLPDSTDIVIGRVSIFAMSLT
jgi:tyrosinase